MAVRPWKLDSQGTSSHSLYSEVKGGGGIIGPEFPSRKVAEAGEWKGEKEEGKGFETLVFKIFIFIYNYVY